MAAALLNSFHVFGLPAATPDLFQSGLHRCFRSASSTGRCCAGFPRLSYSGRRAGGRDSGGRRRCQLAMQIPALVRRGMNFVPACFDLGPRRAKGRPPDGTRVFRHGRLPDQSVRGHDLRASSPRMPSGSITSLYVADRVMQLVLGSYAIAMSTALLPTMSHQIAAGKWDEMKHTFGFSLRIVSFITIPAAVGLILLRRPIIQVLFQHGRFVAESTSLTAHALFFYSLGLAGVCRDQAHHADVLLDAGYVDARARRRLGARRRTSFSMRFSCCSFSARFRTAARRWPVR